MDTNEPKKERSAEIATTALLACPFCGSLKKVSVWPAEVGPRKGFRAGCLDPECDINPFTRTIWDTEHEAEGSWNRRKRSGLAERLQAKGHKMKSSAAVDRDLS